MGITIRDVALKAGVSPATVSRVYNGAAGVSNETQLRVLSVAHELKYVPNATARSLSTSRTHVIGFVMPVPHSEFFAELMRGVDAAVTDAGYSLLITAVHHSFLHADRGTHPMTGRIDGLLLAASNMEEAAAFQSVLPGIPKVWMLCHPPEEADAIRIDNIGGARSAVRHLVELGHRRIAHIIGRNHNWDAEERLEAYREVLQESGIPHDPALEVRGDFTRHGGYAAAQELLRVSPRPTAIFAANDNMAIGALSALHEAGIRIPEDIALIGFDCIPGSGYMIPALSSVRVPVREMGRMAAERIIARLEGHDEGPRASVVETELVVRNSTARNSAARNGGRLEAVLEF